MNLFNLTEVGYEIPEKKVGQKTYPARVIPPRDLCLNPYHIISIEEPDDGEDHVRVYVVGAHTPYEVEGTFEEVTRIWANALGGAR